MLEQQKNQRNGGMPRFWTLRAVLRKVLIIPDSLMAEHIALDDDMYVRLVLGEPFAPLSEWLGTALQKLEHWFKSSMVLHGSVAQWLEQSPHKTLVRGSSPFGPNYILER